MNDESVDRWSRALSHRRQLTPASWYVLCELLEYEGRSVAATSHQLADATGLGRDAVRRALRELATSGLIARTHDRDDAGRFEPRAYVVLPAPAATRPAPENPSPDAPRPRRPRRAVPAPTALGDQLSLLDTSSSRA